MLLTVVYKGNCLAALFNTIYGHVRPAVVAPLQDSDMGDGLPVPIVHLERILLSGLAWIETQLVLSSRGPRGTSIHWSMPSAVPCP